MTKRYVVIEIESDDLEDELNKADYELYEVASIAYSGTKVICVLEQKYFE